MDNIPDWARDTREASRPPVENVDSSIPDWAMDAPSAKAVAAPTKAEVRPQEAPGLRAIPFARDKSDKAQAPEEDETHLTPYQALVKPLMERGISDENYRMLGGDGPVAALRPLTNILPDTADLLGRLGTAAMNAPGLGAHYLDKAIDATGINDTSLVKDYLPGAIHPGAALMQAMEAFPDGGVGHGLTAHPQATKADIDAGNAAIADAVKAGKSVEEVQAIGLQHGLKADPAQIKAAIDYRNAHPETDPSVYTTGSEQPPPATEAPTRDQRVAERAYQKFQESGGEHGNDDKHWNDAAAEIDREDANAEAEKADAEHHQAITQHVASVIKGWKNAPDVHVINRLEDIQDPVVRKQVESEGGHDAYGIYGSDGKVYLNANNIHSVAEANGVLYHETLGHHGLRQEFQDKLDGILQNVYDTNPKYQELTDQWMADNPKGYNGPDRTVRALEEVLADESAKGNIQPTVKGRLTNFVKTIGRKAGIRLKYSDADVEHILAMAHDRVINGKGRATPEGVNRFMYGGFGSMEADYGSILDASDRLKEGENPVDVYRDTGMFRGPDDQMRFEFSDRGAKFSDKFDEMYSKGQDSQPIPLEDAIDHPELFEHYPSIGKTKIQWDAHGGDTSKMGSYDPRDNTIRINPEATHPEKDMGLSTVLHEIQHNIQDIEGWSQGGSDASAVRRLSDDQFRALKKGILDDLQAEHDRHGAVAAVATKLETSDKFRPVFDDYMKSVEDFARHYDDEGNADFDKKEVRDAYDRRQAAETKMSDFIFGEGKSVADSKNAQVKDVWYALRDWGHSVFDDLRKEARQNQDEVVRKGETVYNADRKGLFDATEFSQRDRHFKNYQNLFGEIEARDTQSRQHMTDAERRETLPYSSANDVPTEDVIAQNQGGTSRYSRPKSAEQIAREQAERDRIQSLGKEDADRIVEGLWHTDELPNLIHTIGMSGKNNPKTFAEVERRARDMNMSPSDVIRNAGARGLAEAGSRIYAMETVRKRVLGRVTDILDRINDESSFHNPSDKVALAREVMNLTAVQSAIEGRVADLARAMNSLKILRDDRLQVTAMMDALKELGGSESHIMDDTQFSRFVKRLKDAQAEDNPNAMGNVASSLNKPYWWQYPLALRHNFMLSGLGTHVKNTYDNLTMMARELEEKTVALAAAPIRGGLRAAGFDVMEGVSPEEVVGHGYGLVRAALDGLKPMRVGNKGPIVGTGGAIPEAVNALLHGHEGHNSKIDIASGKSTVPDARIPYVSKVGDFLHAQDQFFRAFLNNANMYSLGIREARANGLKGKAAFDDGVQRAMNPSVEMITQSNNLSNIALLVDKPFFQKIEDMKAIKPNMTKTEQARAFGANVVFPFFRVTDRLIAQKIRRSPLSVFDRVTREDFMAGGARRDIAIARTLMGSALIWYYWHKSGNTPAGNYQKNASLSNGGYLPNAVDDGDRYTDATALNLSLNPYDTHNAIAANVATIRAAYRKGVNEDDTATRLKLATKAMLHQLASDSALSQMNQYIDPFISEDNASTDTKIGNVLGSLVASGTVPAGLRQINSVAVDPMKRDTSVPGSISRTAANRVITGIPVASKYLPLRYDAYGHPQVQGKTWLGIANYQMKSNDPVIQAVQSVEMGQDNPVIGGAAKSIKVNGKTQKLSGQVYADYNRLAGETFYNTIKPYVEAPGWKDSDEAYKVKTIKKVMQNSRKAARTSMFGGPE